MFQQYVYTHGQLRQTNLIVQVKTVVTNEIFRQLVHRHVRPFVVFLYEIFADSQILVVMCICFS